MLAVHIFFFPVEFFKDFVRLLGVLCDIKKRVCWRARGFETDKANVVKNLSGALLLSAHCNTLTFNLLFKLLLALATVGCLPGLN